MRKRLVVDLVIWGAALSVLLAVGGCTRVPLTDVEGPRGLDDQRVTQPTQGAEELSARVLMGVGELRLGATEGDDAMEAEFRYSPRTWKPEVEYSVEGSTGVLSVEQPTVQRGIENLGAVRNEWDIRLNRSMPLDLEVKLGAGESTLELSKLDVREVDVLIGVGETTVDLTGPRSTDVDVRVEGGVGELNLILPSEIGVRLETISEGIGDLSVDGMFREGETYVNEAYGESPVTMTVTLHRGVGDVDIEVQ